jgi:hypothetical protein
LAANKKGPDALQGPSDHQQIKNIRFQLQFPDYCALIPVVPVMMVMMVAIVMMVVTMMTVPSCGWDRAAGRDCANNA